MVNNVVIKKIAKELKRLSGAIKAGCKYNRIRQIVINVVYSYSYDASKEELEQEIERQYACLINSLSNRRK